MSPAASPRPQTGRLDWPLMKNNLARQDLDAVIDLLRQEDPILTHAERAGLRGRMVGLDRDAL
jgi:CDP-4-dehydro-6-deoxyglucose reductase, E1